MTFKFAKTNKVRLHYVFGSLDYIEVPALWRYDIQKQKDALLFIKLYQSWKYLQDMFRTNDDNLINYAKDCFYESFDKAKNIDNLFKTSYPVIFKFENYIKTKDYGDESM